MQGNRSSYKNVPLYEALQGSMSLPPSIIVPKSCQIFKALLDSGDLSDACPLFGHPSYCICYNKEEIVSVIRVLFLNKWTEVE